VKQSLTYIKARLAISWPCYKRIVGCVVDCDNDCAGYVIESDGSRTGTSDISAAKILLFSRLLAARSARKDTIGQAIHCYLCRFANWVLF